MSAPTPAGAGDATHGSYHSDAFIGMHGGRLIYVLVKDRATFDAIDLPVTDHGEKPGGHCFSKAMGGEPVPVPQPYLIFQYWADRAE